MIQARRNFLKLVGTTLPGVLLAEVDNSIDASEVKSITQPGISEHAFRKAQQRAVAMVGKMTLDEKIAQTGNNAPAIKRIGLPAYNYYSGEALHGLVRGGPVTSFPLPLAMTCSWNPECH